MSTPPPHDLSSADHSGEDLSDAPLPPDSGNFSRDVEVMWQGHHPQRIGPYRIVEILGTGGMGTVYLAEQTRPVRRRVALKLLDRRLKKTTHEQRFQAECQAMARMNHPGIAHFYGAGVTQGGHSFLVLEHVDGPSIVDYCDLHRLSIDARLRLFRKLCDAVQHAHQKAIIHRDLKPGNVLVEDVDDNPVPKVIDFGIAKGLDTPLSDSEGLTQGLVGTPLYLSPEAILAADDDQERDAALDTRSDVYALGMMLFKLLVGMLPLERDQGNMVRVIRRIVEQDLPRASMTFAALPESDRERLATSRSTTPAALERKLHGDLDWILCRAVHRNRDRRYDSASHLSADLKRHLQSLPVSVGPPSRLYQLGKFVRRNRAAVLIGTIAFLALAVSTIGLGVLYQHAQQSTQNALQEAESAHQVSQFLVDLFAQADPTTSTESTASARDLLDRGARMIHEDMRDQPETRADLLLAIGRAYTNLQQRDEAEAMLTEALELIRQMHGEEHIEAAEALQALGFLRWTQGREDEAEQLLQRTLEIQQNQLGWDSAEVVETLSLLGGMLGQSGRLAEAETFLRRALEIQALQPDVDLRQRAVNLFRIGSLQGQLGNMAQAQREYELALELFTEIHGSNHPVIGDVLVGQCLTLGSLERWQQAAEACQRSLEIRLEHLGPDHVKTSQSQLNLAGLYMKQQRYADAEPQLRAALETRRRNLRPGHPRTLAVQQSLAVTLSMQAEEQPTKGHEALQLFENLLGQERNNLPSDHPQRRETLNHYAELLHRMGRDDQAIEIERQLLEQAPPIDSETP